MVDETSNGLDMRNVGNFVLDRVKYSNLKGNEPVSMQAFAIHLVDSISRVSLVKTDIQGAYLQLFIPFTEEEGTNTVAVKIFDHLFSPHFEASINKARKTPATDLQQILDDRSYIVFDKKTIGKLEDISETQLGFLYLAYEHSLFQKFYGKYVLPAIFLEFNPRSDVISSDPIVPKDLNPKKYKAFLSQTQELARWFDGKGRLTADGRRIYIKKGELEYAMIQNKEKLGPSVFDLKPNELTTDQKKQLIVFAQNIRDVYAQDGYFPDPTMHLNGSGNLRFNKDGKLLLLDTNQLHHKDTSQSSPNGFLKALDNLTKT